MTSGRVLAAACLLAAGAAESGCSGGGCAGGDGDEQVLLQLRQRTEKGPFSKLGEACTTDACCLRTNHAVCLEGTCQCEAGFHESHGRCRPGYVPVAWCTAGGGLRALAAAQGYANAFNKAGLFDYEELAAVASNSGGGWWLSSFSFDPDYYDKNLQEDREAYKTWLEDIWTYYDTALGPGPNPADPGPLGQQGQLLLYMYTVAIQLGFGQGIFDLLANPVATYNFQYSWRKLVQVLFQNATTAKLEATSANRMHMKGPSIHFQVSGMTNFYVADPTQSGGQNVGWALGKQVGGSAPVLAFEGGRDSGLTPMQYVLPGTTRPRTKRQGMQPPEVTEVQWAQEGAALSATFDLYPASAPAAGSLANETDLKPLPPLSFSVEQLAAASSAQPTRMASPIMAMQMASFNAGYDAAKMGAWLAQPTPFGPTIGDFFQGKQNMGLNKIAVCGRPINDDDDCPYGSELFADGGFIDNFGAAMTLVDLQKRYGKKRTLRMLLSDNNGQSFGLSNMAEFFKVDGVAPGTFRNGSFTGTRYPSPQVFAEEFDSITWTNLTLTDNNADPVKYAKATVTTVDNPAFGSVAGQKVELLLLFVYTEAATLFGSVPDYVSVALSTADGAVAALVKDWLAAR